MDCGSRKAVGKHWQAPLQSVVASRPYERVALDILGPLPETPKDNKYIVVIGDYFSKWTEAFPLPNQEAETVAKLLVEQWVCRFGAPRIIHTDQGRNFESRLFKEVCQLLNIYKTSTSPYHPQSDGMIERFNRTLASMLSLFVDDNQANWDILLPYVMMAYRSSVHSSTGFTPYKVFFGKEIVLPVDVMLNLGDGERFSSASEYVARLLETLSTVVEAVKGHQLRASVKQKGEYDFRAHFQYYSEGELVWVRGKVRKRGLCPKLQRRFRGPYKVTERITEVLYRLVPVEGGTEIVVHFNRLKPCLSSVTEVTNQEGAESPRMADISPKETWLQTSASTAGRESEVVVPGARSEVPPGTPTRGASSVPGSWAASVGSQGQRDRLAPATQSQGGQESSDTGHMQTSMTSHSAMTGEAQQGASLSKDSRQG